MDKLAEAKLYAEKNKETLILCKNNNIFFLRLNHNDWLALKKYAIDELKVPEIKYSVREKPVVTQPLPQIKPHDDLCALLDEVVAKEKTKGDSRVLDQAEVDFLLEFFPKRKGFIDPKKPSEPADSEPVDIEADMVKCIKEEESKAKPVTDSAGNVIINAETIQEIRNRLLNAINKG